MTREAYGGMGEEQVHAILAALMALVGGRLDGRLPVEDPDSPVDAIHAAINETAEELAFKERRRREAEAALRRSEEWWHSLVEHVPDVVVATDLEGRILYMNAAMPGITPAEAEGADICDCFLPEHQAKMRAAMSAVVETGKHQRHVIEREGGDGGSALYSARVNVIKQDGLPAGLVFVLTDITEQRMLERQLRGSQRMESIGRLAGGVAHDFNNLLAVIFGFAGFLLDDLDERDPAREDLKEIIKASERAADLTRQLLAFSRRQVMNPTVLDLNAVITDMEKMLRRTIGEDVELILGLGEGIGCVKADRAQVEQVLINLAVNARDAMPRGGAITVETTAVELDEGFVRAHTGAQMGEHIMLAVSDTGCGMDDDVAERVFEPFFTTKPDGKGTGLGLSTVYGIVKQNNGSVWVYSELDHGTTFKIYLPRTQDSRAAPHPATPRIAQLKGDETILLVEDDEAVRKATSRMLRKAGYNVLEAETGGDALLIAEQHAEPIALMLSDVVMPRMNGPQLAERLVDVRPEMLVLFMSGYTADAVAQHGVLEEELPLIEKPFAEEALLRKVREVLDAS